jgi:hypothetical protein
MDKRYKENVFLKIKIKNLSNKGENKNEKL